MRKPYATTAEADEANERLFSAAPALLAALQTIVRAGLLDAFKDAEAVTALSAARAAIARATQTGEE